MMTIARWKAQRARGHFAKRLLSKGAATLQHGARSLTRALADASSDEARFEVVCGDWEFPLPTGSAILTVCFPSAFSVYDIRVCNQLGEFRGLASKTRVAERWAGYTRFLEAVRGAAPVGLSLRDCDRWLWGQSRYEDLQAFLSSKSQSTAARRQAR